MWMHEQGHLDVNEPINKFLSYEVRNPAFPDKPITILQLLIHTSSISDEHFWDLDEKYLYSKNDGTKPLSGRVATMDDFFRCLLARDGKLFHKATFGRRAPGTYRLLQTFILRSKVTHHIRN